MRKQYRSFLVALLVPVAVAAAPTNWSDPASWPNRKVPVAGDKVTIGRDKDVVPDVSAPALGGLSIDGKLTFPNNADVELTTEWVMLHGELEVGTKVSPCTHKAAITLSDNVKGENVMGGMGERKNTRTKLASTAKAT
jgi:cell migration-inducing and hyaluronan-binding protein